MRSDDVLFWKYDWHAVTEAQKAAVRKKVSSMGQEAFDGASLDDLAGQLANEFSLAPPHIDADNIEVSQREVDIDVSGDRDRYFSRPGPHYMKGTAIDVRVPFTGDREMFNVKPTTYNFNPPIARIGRDCVEFSVTGVGLTPEKVKAEIDSRINSISEYLQFQEKSIGNFPEELRRVSYQALEQRQQKLKADSDLISGLGYKTR